MTTTVQPRTRGFARVLGPYFTIVALIAILRSPDIRQVLSEFTDSDVWPWVMGALILITGIAIVAFHQIWRGAAAIVISVLGWLLVIRGIFLIAFPEVFASLADRIVGAVGVWKVAYVVMILLGLYLTYVGWKPVRTDLQGDHLRIDVEFPHAA